MANNWLLSEHFPNIRNNISWKNKDGDKQEQNILKDSGVNSNFGYLCDDAACRVEKEVSLYLLKRIIQLYARVRWLSRAKDIKEKYQMKNKSVKQKSLRAGVKMKKANET